MAATILEARAVITGEDKTGAMFASIEKRMAGLSKASTAMNKAVNAMASSRMIDGLSNFDNKFASSRMIERLSAMSAHASKAATQISRLGESMRGLNNIQHLAAGLALERVAAKALEARRAIAETYREFDKERRYGAAVMGISDDQQAPLVRQAIHMGGSTKFNDIQVLESQRELAARGLNIDQVRALTEVAARIGQAMDKSLPESVKALEGAMFGFAKDTSSYTAAVQGAGRTADLLVKGSKISGMNYEDLVELYKFSATPFRFAGLSEEQLLAFGGIGKKSNMGGAEMGTAGRALVANLLSPTAGARTAMLAAGIDYSKYQTLGAKPMSADVFANDVAMKYGVALDGAAKKSLQRVFNNNGLVGDAAKFMPAILGVLGDVLGGDDAKSKKSIAGEARRYRDASVAGVDSQRLFNDLMVEIAKNPALANTVFGAKQGARIRTAIGDPELFLKKMDELINHSQGYAQSVSDARMAGFDGAVSRFEGAVKNVETAIGRSLDNDGRGGFLTGLADSAARVTQSFAEMPPAVHQLTAALGAGSALYVSAKSFQNLMSGFGLSTSAAALDTAAANLNLAAGRLGASGVPGLTGGLKSAAAGAGATGAASVGLLPLLALGAAAAGADYWFNTEIGPPTRRGGRGALQFPEPRIGFTPVSEIPDASAHSMSGFAFDRIGHYSYGRGGNRWHDDGAAPMGDAPLPMPRGWGAMSGAIAPGQITAKLEGEGNISVTIRIEAGSELFKAVEAARSVSSFGNIKLNVGTSGPETRPEGRHGAP